jgi:hypothetical protein
MPTEAERVCLECTLIAPQCDGTDKDCKFVQIVGKRSDYSLGIKSVHKRVSTPESRAKAAVTRRKNQQERMTARLAQRTGRHARQI